MGASTRRRIERGAPGRRDAGRRGRASPACGFAGAPGLESRAVAFLGAFCFFLSAVEYMVPKPLPFMRLGIANLPILIGARFLPLPGLLALALVKVIGMSLVSGTLFSYVALFSLAGTMTAALAMWAVFKAPPGLVTSAGASVLGAVASNAAQLTLADLFIFREVARLAAPPFMAAGLVTGLLLGIFAELFAEKSEWLASVTGTIAGSAGRLDASRQRAPSAAPPIDAAAAPAAAPEADAGPRVRAPASRAKARRAARRGRWEAALRPGTAALVGALCSLAFLVPMPLAARAAFFAAFAAVAWLAGKRISWTAVLLTSASIVAANLLVPVGEVLARLGPLRITRTALLDGIDKALIFEGLLFASKAFIRRGLRLPGRLGAIIASAFESYDAIVEREAALRPSTLIADADALALEVWEAGTEGGK